MNEKDYYKTLGINPNNCTLEIVKKSRIKLLKAHPDQGGTSELFIKTYQAYKFLYNKYFPSKVSNPSEDSSKRKHDLEEEVIEAFYQQIFSRYIHPEFDYFLGKIPDIKRYFERLEENKNILFNEDMLRDPYSLMDSPVFCLNGSLFYALMPDDLVKMFQYLISQKPFDTNLFEKFITLNGPKEDLCGSIPLKGNIIGLDFGVILNAPKKSMSKRYENGGSFVKIFGEYWKTEKVKVDLRMGEYWKYHDGIYALKSNPIALDIKSVPIFFKTLLEGIVSKDFELELSVDIPRKHPNHDYFAMHTMLKQGEGFFVKNLRAKDVEMITEGKPKVVY